jgi:microcompartment protein CcmL/EutN
MESAHVDTLGVVESRTIAAGVILADAMVKAADVVLLRASTVCSGRYLVFVSGDREAVATAVQTARDSQARLSGSFVIANVAPQVLEILKGPVLCSDGGALGVVECRTVSSGIAACDAAVKRADIRLRRLVAGQGINGKSYFAFSGDVAAVEEAVAAVREALERDVIDSAVIPRPDEAVVKAVTGAMR